MKSTMQRPILFILCVVVAVNTVAINPQPKDLFDDIKALLEEYRNTVNNVLHQASTKFIQTQNELRRHGEAVYRIAGRILTQSQRSFIQQLRDLEQHGIDNGVAATTCTFYQLQELNEMPYNLLNQANQCVRAVTADTEQVLRQAFHHYDNLNGTVEDYARRIEECWESDDTVCVLMVATQMGLQNELLPILFENEMREIDNQFTNMDVYFQDCFSAPTQEFDFVGRNIVETVRQCIQNLIDSKESESK